MKFNCLQPTLAQLNISVDEVLDLLKVDERTDENPVYSEVHSVYDLLLSLCEIRGGYVVFEDIETDFAKGEITLNGSVILPGRKVCAYLRKSEKIALFICSAGEQFSVLSKKAYAGGDYLRGYIIDAFGSVVAEHTADFIHDQIQEFAKTQDLKITNRYSPGYCNWHLSNQKDLFTLLPENPCRISLTESCLMIPIKSVSGIIGMGRDVKRFTYKCQTCNDKDCTYRKILNR